MIELDEHLKLIPLRWRQCLRLLPGEQHGDALFRSRGWAEGAQAFLAGGVSDEFDDFLEWFHNGAFYDARMTLPAHIGFGTGTCAAFFASITRPAR